MITKTKSIKNYLGLPVFATMIERWRQCAVASDGDVLTFDVDSRCYRRLFSRVDVSPYADHEREALARQMADPQVPSDVEHSTKPKGCGCKRKNRKDLPFT